jgi:hypothetical protein
VEPSAGNQDRSLYGPDRTVVGWHINLVPRPADCGRQQAWRNWQAWPRSDGRQRQTWRLFHLTRSRSRRVVELIMSVAGGRSTTKDDLATAVALQLTRRMTSIGSAPPLIPGMRSTNWRNSAWCHVWNGPASQSGRSRHVCGLRVRLTWPLATVPPQSAKTRIRHATALPTRSVHIGTSRPSSLQAMTPQRAC